MRFGQYASYRESGAAWLGDVPSHWKQKRLKFLVDLIDEKVDGENVNLPFVGLENIESWTGRLTADEGLKSTGVVNKYQRGDVLFGRLRPYLAKVHEAETAGICTGEALVLRSRETLHPRFLFYALLSPLAIENINSSTYGAKMPRASWQFIGDQIQLLPSLDEQRSICRFLDREISRIDALTEKQCGLLELLEEKRLMTITQAVTKGLDPNVPLKDSGIKWLGKVPAHWETNRIKFLAAVGNGSTPKRDNPVYWVDGEYPWLNSSVVNLEEVDAPTELITRAALDECHLPIVKPPAVVIGITGEGRTRGMVSTLTIEATINQHLAFLKPTSDRMSVSYLRRVLEIAYSYLRSESDGGGSTKGAITCEQLGELVVPVPPRKEQEVISANIRQAIETMSETRKVISRAVERLKEYRSALITNAVIGKIDVRNLVGDEAAA